MSEYSDVVVIADQIQNDLRPVTFELLGAGSNLAKKLGVSVKAIVMGSNLDDIPQRLIHNGADEVFVVDKPELADYTTLTYRRAAIAVLDSLDRPPHIVLCGATTIGARPGPQDRRLLRDRADRRLYRAGYRRIYT